MVVLATTLRRGLAATLVLLAVGGPAAAQQNIGATSIVVNRVTGALGGETRTLKLGSQVRRNEVIETAKGARTQIIFEDETTLSLAPLTKFTLDEMVYDPGTGDGALTITVTVGALRFISGALASPKNYKINTPVGTIGIRGTIFDLSVAASGATTIVLRAGSIVFTNLAGASQALTQPGTSTTVATGAATPTPPGPPPAAVMQVLTGITGSRPPPKTQIGMPGPGEEGDGGGGGCCLLGPSPGGGLPPPPPPPRRPPPPPPQPQ